MKPQVLMTLFDSELRDELFILLDLAGIKNYTHFVGLRGSSPIGKKEGSVAWPGTNEILLLILNDDEVGTFKNIIADFKKRREQNPGLLAFNWELKDLM